MAAIVEHLENGVTVYQVTDSPHITSNIYCERPYASEDGRRFLYARRMDPEANDWEYVLCEFGTWTERVVGRGELSVTVSYNNDTYYSQRTAAGVELHRIDFGTGANTVAFRIADPKARAGHPAVSPDARYLAWHDVVSFDPQQFCIVVADLETGKQEVVCEDAYLCNAHLQFDPAEGRILQVQHNRGCEFTPEGTRVLLVGEEGATVFLLDIRDGKRTPLRVGKPFTTPMTGHQTWVGQSDEMIATVAATGHFLPEKGNIVLVRPGQDARQIGAGWRMCHIGSTPCGSYFHADGYDAGPASGVDNAVIIVGSPRSGKTRYVCHSHAAYSALGFGQQGHPHAYLTPDFRWVVFNSDRTGTPQTYAAKLPEHFLDGLE